MIAKFLLCVKDVMKITNIKGREIFDSRGFPTLECNVFLEHGISISASIPSGLSKGSYEAYELRDGGKHLEGRGVLKAIEQLETVIAPVLRNREPNIIEMDQEIIELDGTDNKSKLGANTMLAVSIALIRAQAFIEQCELYEFIAQLCGAQTVTLPFPILNMISGGSHARNNMRIQEFLIVPIGANNFRQAMEQGVIFFHT